MEKIKWTDKVSNAKVLRRVDQERKRLKDQGTEKKMARSCNERRESVEGSDRWYCRR